MESSESLSLLLRDYEADLQVERRLLASLPARFAPPERNPDWDRGGVQYAVNPEYRRRHKCLANLPGFLRAGIFAWTLKSPSIEDLLDQSRLETWKWRSAARVETSLDATDDFRPASILLAIYVESALRSLFIGHSITDVLPVAARFREAPAQLFAKVSAEGTPITLGLIAVWIRELEIAIRDGRGEAIDYLRSRFAEVPTIMQKKRLSPVVYSTRDWRNKLIHDAADFWGAPAHQAACERILGAATIGCWTRDPVQRAPLSLLLAHRAYRLASDEVEAQRKQEEEWDRRRRTCGVCGVVRDDVREACPTPECRARAQAEVEASRKAWSMPKRRCPKCGGPRSFGATRCWNGDCDDVTRYEECEALEEPP